MTIGSLNLHCGLTARGRPFDVAAAIARLPADIVALQETWRPHPGRSGAERADDASAAEGGAAVRVLAAADGGAAARGGASGRDGAPGRDGTPRRDGTADGVEAAARELGGRLIRATVRDGATLADLGIAASPERGTWGIAVLSRLPVISHETIDLGRAPGDVASRVALICLVTTPGGWPLRLVATHLTHRFTSPVQLARLAGHLVKSRVPTIISGDLNMPRPATWLAGYAGFAPTVRGATFPAHRPIIQLDHLLAGPGLACSGATVLPSAGSDHLPVLAGFRLRRPPGASSRGGTEPRTAPAPPPTSWMSRRTHRGATNRTSTTAQP